MSDRKTPPKGGRARTGTVLKTKSGLLQAVITLADGSRKRLKPFPKGTSDELARVKTEQYSQEAITRGLVAKPKSVGPTGKSGADWWARFFAYRDELGLTPHTGLYTLHIKPIADTHPSEWTTETCEAVRNSLDERVIAEELSAKTAFNAWAYWTTACKAAAGMWKKDKRRVLRERDGDPCVGVAPPDLDDPKDLQWLYPDEFTKLVGCPLVPADWRIRYILATMLYLRGSELAALTWDDIDVERGIVKIRYSYNQQTKARKQTKTGNKGNRTFAIEPVLLPLLRAMHRERESNQVIGMPARKHWAACLRDHLAVAGIERTELFTTDKTSKRLRFHDLRSTGLTWLAIRGDDPLKIQSRAGHSTFEMTQKYLRAAEDVERAIDASTVFPALPESIANRSVTRNSSILQLQSQDSNLGPGG